MNAICIFLAEPFCFNTIFIIHIPPTRFRTLKHLLEPGFFCFICSVGPLWPTVDLDQIYLAEKKAISLSFTRHREIFEQGIIDELLLICFGPLESAAILV